jgi:hypothetical protein
MNEFPMFCGRAWRKGDDLMTHHGLWFRVYGYGLHICTRRKSDAFFSERSGLRKASYFFGLRFEVLKPE